MRNSLVKSLAAVALSFGIVGAAHAGNVVEESSPVVPGARLAPMPISSCA